jgi:hypothetical protein
MKTMGIRSQDSTTTRNLFIYQIEAAETCIESIAIHLADLHSESVQDANVEFETPALLKVQEQYRQLLLTLQNAVTALQ